MVEWLDLGGVKDLTPLNDQPRNMALTGSRMSELSYSDIDVS